MQFRFVIDDMQISISDIHPVYDPCNTYLSVAATEPFSTSVTVREPAMHRIG